MKSSISYFLIFLLLFSSCSQDDDTEQDAKVPVINFVSPEDETEFTKGEDIVININAEDEDGNIEKVDLYLNGDKIYSWDSAPYTYNLSTDNMNAGDYTLEAKAYDNDGLSATASIHLKIIEQLIEDYKIYGSLKDRYSDSPLEDITIRFDNTDTITDNEGKFYFESNDINHLSITSDVNSDYIPVEYSWDFEEGQTYDFSLYAYPKYTPVNSRNSDFIKGVSLFDAGPWMAEDLYPDAFIQTFDRLQQIHTNTVTVFDPVFVTAVGLDSVAMSTTANTTYTWNMLDADQYRTLSDEAQAKGMNMMYWFGVWPQDEQQLDGKSFNEIVFSGQVLSDEFWDDWFSEYARILKIYAEIAEEKGVEWISIGHGLTYATSPQAFSSVSFYESKWTTLINEIRSVYSGKIIYFGMARPFTTQNYSGSTEVEYYEDEGYTDNFKNLFDAFGVILSNITETVNPSVSQIKTDVENILDHYSDFNKPIVLWIWAPSVDGAANTYGHLEPVLDISSDANNWDVDFYEQADIYEGILEAVNESSVDILGVISHGYMYFDKFTEYEPRNMNTAFEKAASVRGKPAEQIINYWYENY